MTHALAKNNSLARQDAISAYMMIAPFLILMVIFSYYVFGTGFVLSLTDAQGINVGEFIGLDNYIEVLTSKDFYLAIKTTVLYTVGALVTQIPVAFLLAFYLNSMASKRYSSVLRASFFLPVLINTVIIALLFRMLFNRDQGIINWVLGLMGLPNQTEWLMNSSFAIPLLILVSFWQWTGFHMVYFLAQLQTIDVSLYEAAKIDGATNWSTLFGITIPLMKGAFAFVLITSAIGCLQMFDLVFMLFPNAQYGPGGVAKTLVAFIFDEAFSQNFRLGYASAIGWLVFVIILSVSVFQLHFMGVGKKEEE